EESFAEELEEHAPSKSDTARDLEAIMREAVADVQSPTSNVQSQLNTGSASVPGNSRQEQAAGAGGSSVTVADNMSVPPGGWVARGTSLAAAENMSLPPADRGPQPGSPAGVVVAGGLPPLASADKFAREVSVESLSTDIRPLGQLDESFIIATDDQGLLLIDQHVAHERIL
ncbi:MAG: hypothetical protein ABR556_14485, partial [Pyrinomonadaceae bacterium]